MRECVSHIGKSIPRERDILMMSEMEGETEIEGRKLRLFVTQNSEERMRRRRKRKAEEKIKTVLFLP